MRFVFGCILGWLLVLATLAAAAWDILGPRAPGASPLRAAGQLWYELDPASLNLVQAVIERYVWAPLWDPVLAGVLRLPAVLVLAVPAVVLALLCHRPRLRRRRRRWFT